MVFDEFFYSLHRVFVCFLDIRCLYVEAIMIRVQSK